MEQYQFLSIEQVDALDEFIKEIKCNLCNEIMNEPFTTPCSHNFCKICIDNFLSKNNYCPDCKLLVYPRDVKHNAMLSNVILSFQDLMDSLYNWKRILYNYLDDSTSTPDTQAIKKLTNEVNEKNGLLKREENIISLLRSI